MMQDVQPELIEKYQILLQNDPKSQVFAPLTEAYRKMGLLEEAFRIAVRGVQYNPQFGGGRIALAKVFLDRDNLTGATNELEKAVELSPDNILAHSLLADCYLKAKRPKEALRSFKMVLFLAPTNEKAQTAVRKLESLTADEYDDDLFEMKPLPQAVNSQLGESVTLLKPLQQATPLGQDLDRVLSLADAYIVRNDLDKAADTLKNAEMNFGSHPEVIKRLKLVNQRHLDVDSPDIPEFTQTASAQRPPPNRKRAELDRKIQMLERLLKRVSEFSQFT